MDKSPTPSSPTDALVESFRKLLFDTSGDLETLKTFDDILTEEIERASSSGSSIDSDAVEELDDGDKDKDDEPVDVDDNQTLPLCKLSTLVEQRFNYLSADTIQKVLPDIDSLYDAQSSRKRYMWLSKVNIPYHFGGKTYQAKLITNLTNIAAIMDKLNSDLGTKLDACLVTRYQSKEQSLSLHQDDEVIIDQDHPICNISIGSTRQIEFWDSASEETGHLQSTLTLDEGSLVLMQPGCQSHLWHKVPPGTQEGGVRYSLSFRKVKNPPPSLHDKPCMGASSHNASPLNLEQFMHESRLHLNTTSSSASQKSNDVPTHLIIGDSMAKGLTNPGTIILSKGGAHPNEIVDLLLNSSDLLHPDDYCHIKTVTLCVGTNALNVTPTRRIPLLDVLSDYDKLVRDLIGYFPRAHIGLFNVLPRICHIRDTYHRIKTFNTFGQNIIANLYPNVFWIQLYWAFVDEVGCLIPSLYGKRFLHLSSAGKILMSDSIKEFQQAFSVE